MVEKLQTIDAVHEAKRAFDMVFQSRDPFNEPFQSQVAKRAIMYESAYLLHGCPDQYQAIVAAAHAIGEQHAYVSGTEGYARNIPFDGPHAYHGIVDISRTSLRDLGRLTGEQGYSGITESALYSTRGTWGVITSHYEHAVIGGTQVFMEVLAQKLDLELAIRQFLAYQKREYERFGGGAPAWVPPLVRHVYGDEIAEQYLKEAEFPVADPEPYQ